jgi:hypothetical protein
LDAIQSHSQKQLLPSTNVKHFDPLLSTASGSQNYPPSIDYVVTIHSFIFVGAEYGPDTNQ